MHIVQVPPVALVVCKAALCCAVLYRIWFCCVGELQEPSKRTIARMIEAQDQLVDQEKEGLGDGDKGP
jgi:hypothetical protein